MYGATNHPISVEFLCHYVNLNYISYIKVNVTVIQFELIDPMDILKI